MSVLVSDVPGIGVPVPTCADGPPLHVLMLLNYFPPEIGSGAHLPYELGESLVDRGWSVTVVTGFPHYNLPEVPPAYRQGWALRERMGGMEVVRVRAPVPYGRSRVARGLFHLLVPATLALRAGRLPRPDVVYTITPPLALGRAARAVARRLGAPCVVHVQDLFPQNAIDLGLLRHRAAIRFFEQMERRVYREADAVVVMSDGNARHVIARGAAPGRVHTVFNWADLAAFLPGEGRDEFRRAHALGEDFVVLFAGTMGWSQGLDVAVEAARRLAAEPGITFLLVGGGVERERLGRLAEGLPNVRFLPMQPKAAYPAALAAADAGLVTLRPEVRTPAVPSKLATILAAGRPVLAPLPPGDAADLVARSGGGVVLPAGDPDSLAAAVLALARQPDRAAALGAAGRRFAREHLAREGCVDRLAAVLGAAAAARGVPR